LQGQVARRLPAEDAVQLGVTMWLATKPAEKVEP
jgi:ArsR family transcriptional regulator